jgi:hypothetical protein
MLEFKNYVHHSKRGTVDKKFLQSVGLITAPPPKRPKRRIQPSLLLLLGKLTGEINALLKERIPNGQKEIMRGMIKKLEENL